MAENKVIPHAVELIVIGGSAGSLDVILRILSSIKQALPVPLIIVIHRKNQAEDILADVLTARTKLVIKEAEEKEMIKPGIVYLAPADYHLLIESDKTFALDDSEKVNYSRPSIDVTFSSAADVYAGGIACILLSGANADGVDSLQIIRNKGGIVAVQDPAFAEVEYMPLQAIKAIEPDFIIKDDAVESFIGKLLQLH
jgi:two-component system chemotaxis response regulator CheB